MITYTTRSDCYVKALYVRRHTTTENHLIFAIGVDSGRGAFRSNKRIFGCFGFRRDCTGGRKGVWAWSLMLPKLASMRHGA